MFSNGSDSSISLVTVIPSFTISGAPNFFSNKTLRPLGPRVTRTASARALTPASSARRDSSSKETILAIRLPLKASLLAIHLVNLALKGEEC